jgi:hypothetical protein
MNEIITGLLRSLLISAGIGVPLFVTGYIMVTPTHILAGIWQNYKTRRKPHRALKDRHFKGLPRRVRLVKIASTLAFFIFLWLGLRQFHIDMWGFLGWVGF